MNGSPGPRVVMLSRELNSYRVGFFEAARAHFDRLGIDFRLLLGGATNADRSKNDHPELEWARYVPTRQFRLRGTEMWWQSCLREANRADLVITEQATKQLLNLPLTMLQRAGFARHCLWGHGRNFQLSIESGSGESVKQWFTAPAHWFFSYTEASTASLLGSGFPADRITTFNNSTDVTAVRQALAALPSDNSAKVRSELDLTSGPIVGYLGGLTPLKRIPFLLNALDELKARVPDINVLVIGAGSEEQLVLDAALDRGWLHPLGAIYGPERVRYGAVCSALLMPGLVGLNVVDGFAMGLPTFTTGIDYHSPEISYLEDGENGWISAGPSTPDAFAADIARVLGDRALLRSLQINARAAGDHLGIEPMAEKFVDGVVAALAAPQRKLPISELVQRKTSR